MENDRQVGRGAYQKRLKPSANLSATAGQLQSQIQASHCVECLGALQIFLDGLRARYLLDPEDAGDPPLTKPA